MPPIVIDLRKAEDERDVVHRTVQALAEGRLVAFPTETVYGLAGKYDDWEVIQKVCKIKRRPLKTPFSIMVSMNDEIVDLIGWDSPPLRRLLRMALPGPIINSHQPGLASSARWYPATCASPVRACKIRMAFDF